MLDYLFRLFLRPRTVCDCPQAPIKTTHAELGGVYQALMAHALNQDALMWSRVQILIAIQGAALAGSYAIRADVRVAIELLALAAVLTLFTLMLARNDLLDRNANQRLMDEMAKALIPHDIAARAGLPDKRGLVVRIVEPDKPWPFRGRIILRGSLWLFFWLDLALAWQYWLR